MSQKAQLPEFGYDYSTDKRRIFESYCKYFFTRTQSMFVYKGLPDSIPVQWLEQYLQRNGSCIIAKEKGELYALIGNVSGERDAYYQPTKYIVANPWLKLSKEYDIGKDCVYCRNDYNAFGLTPLISRYCGLMTENLLTTRVADINMRMMFLLSAADDDTVLSTKDFLKDLEAGKLSVIAEDGFFDGVKMQSKNGGHGDYMIQFIELQQYLKGSLYNELGINANFNMKREAINKNEASLNDDALMPLIDDMLKQRRIMCDELNEMFGLDVSVDYGSSWHSNVAEKMAVGGSELMASESEANAMGGDEQILEDDGSDIQNDGDKQNEDDHNSVSRLNDLRGDTDEAEVIEFPQNAEETINPEEPDGGNTPDRETENEQDSNIGGSDGEESVQRSDQSGEEERTVESEGVDVDVTVYVGDNGTVSGDGNDDCGTDDADVDSNGNDEANEEDGSGTSEEGSDREGEEGDESESENVDAEHVSRLKEGDEDTDEDDEDK